MRRKIKMFLAVLVLLLNCNGCREKNVETTMLEEVNEGKEKEEQEETEQKGMQSIFVYVCGAVLNEGVYELPEGSRVYEAIEEAGGFQEGAAVSYINQAELLQDEERLYIPTVEEVESQQLQMQEQNEDSGKINLNTASKEELMTLPGIGAAKAASIIEYREQKGSFQSIEEIKNIQGIKDGVFDKIKDCIIV